MHSRPTRRFHWLRASTCLEVSGASNLGQGVTKATMGSAKYQGSFYFPGGCVGCFWSPGFPAPHFGLSPLKPSATEVL